MKDFNIKCNNKKEAEFIKKYLLDKGCIFDFIDLIEFNICEFKAPIILFNVYDDLSTIYFVDDIEVFNFEICTVIEAKHIIRKEKLKRISNGRS